MRAGHPIALVIVSLLVAGCSRSGGAGDPLAAAEPAGYLGPSLTVSSPARGAWLTVEGDGPAPLTLQGEACDPVHPLASLTVQGAALPVRPVTGCQPFRAEVTSRPGLVVIEGEVVNAAGQRGRLAQAVLRAPGWFATADGDPAAAVPAGLLLRLGPAALDDGDRASADDAATLAARVLAGVDLDAAVGPSRFASPDADGDGAVDEVTHRCLLYTVTSAATGFQAWKDGALTWEAIAVDSLAPVAGGLSARLTLRGLRLPFAVTGHLDSGCLGSAQKTVRGTVRIAAVTLAARAELGLEPGGKPRVALTDVTSTLSGLDVDIALGPLADWTGLGSLLGDAVEARVRGPIQDALRAAVTGRFQAWLAAAAGRIATLEIPLALPAALGGGRLLVGSRLERLEGSPEGLLAASALTVRAEAPSPAHAGALGAPRLGGGPPGLPAAPLTVGLHLDAANQLLHAAWKTGAFDLDDLSRLVDLAGPPTVRLSVSTGLPPVLTLRPEGRPGAELGLGEVAFVLQLEGARPGATASARGFLALRIGVEGLALGAGGRPTFRPVLAGAPEVAVEVTAVDWAPGPAGREQAAALLRQLVESRLPGLLERALAAVPLPAVELSVLDPALAGARLELEAPRATLDGRYVLVGASLAASP